MLLVRRLLTWMCMWAACQAAVAEPLRLTVQGLASWTQPVILALDFTSAGGNHVSVSDFTSDGTLSLNGKTGTVQGGVASGLDFTGGNFFSEALLRVNGADSLAFTFDTSSNGPAAGGFPDAFTALFLDAVTGLPLLDSSDPLGTGSLFLYSIDGTASGSTQLYLPLSGGVTWGLKPVNTGPGGLPEPASLTLLALALVLLGLPGGVARLRRALIAAVGLVLSFAAATVHAEDLTGSVELTRSGLVLNRVTNTFDATVAIKNTSTDTLLGPLKLALTSATPAEVALYNARGQTAAGADYVVVPLSTGTLAPGASASAVVRLIATKQGITSTSFAVEGQRLISGKTATLSIQGVYAAGYQGPQESPVGAGLRVVVNGVPRGLTDATGRLDVVVPAGPAQVTLTNPPNEGGSETVQAAVGASLNVKVAVDGGKEIGTDASLRIDAVQQGLLARSAPRVVARFQDANDQSLRLTLLNDVSVEDIQGRSRNLSSLFSLQADGSVAASSAAAFFNGLAGLSGRLSLVVSGETADGSVHTGAASFYLTDYRARVKLLAPPSNPALPVANVRVLATILNTPLRFQAQSDANGLVVLPDLPRGNLSLKAVTTAGGVTYTGAGTAALNFNALVSLTLRAPQDVLANVPPISVQPLPANLSGIAATQALIPALVPEAAPVDPQRLARDQALQRSAPSGVVKRRAQAAGAVPSVSVSVASAAQNATIENSASLTVPKGTKKLTLSYVVATAEYPVYVLQQSIYNDVWSLSVAAPDGSSLFEQTRQINSQLSQEPVWLPNGSTGTIKKEFDVASYTASADAAFVLRASSVNIGDSLLATSVNATLDASEPLVITSAEDTGGEVTTNNDGSFYSIPRSGATNTLQRTLTAELTKPSGSTLTKVSVDLLDGTSGQLMAVLTDIAPGAAGVEVLNQDDTSAKLKVRVTMQNPASTVAGVPPPTRDIAYRLTVKANDANGNEIQDQKTVSGKRSLWRMPDGLTRYGARDNGGDDWVSRGGYNWLVTNNALLQAIDDVSGEHGRNIGHSTHERGTDIDMYHFYRFPGATTGASNHSLLITDVVAAFGTLQNPAPPAATAAFNRVAAWVAATRTGLTNFTALASVNFVIHCQGVATQGLPAGWCSGLIQNGTVSRTVAGPAGPVTQNLNFGGTFASTKMRWRNDHNDHVHIALDRPQIGE